MAAQRTTPAALAPITKVAAGEYRATVAGHSLLITRVGNCWWVEGEDNRTDDMCRDGVYLATAYSTACQFLDDSGIDTAPKTLKTARETLAGAGV